MRPDPRLDDAIYAVAHHPLTVIGFGIAAALLSWLLTRAGESG